MHIDLSGNQIDGHLIDEIDAIVSQRQTQTGRSSGVGEIIDQVRSNDPNLTEVLLDNMRLGSSPETEALFDALAQNTVVRKLSLCNNGIEDSLAAALSLAIVENFYIKELILRDNGITSEGCEYVSEVGCMYIK